MNSQERQLEFLKESAKSAFVPLIARDFGELALLQVGKLTDNITSIYKNLRIRDFNSITVFTPLKEDLSLSGLAPNVIEIANIEAFTSIQCENIVIEINGNKISYCTDWNLDPNTIRDKAIVYRYEGEQECFFGKSEVSILPDLPDSESYFQYTTYKDLEEAFEEYEQKRARHSSCPYLEKVWHPAKRILFVPSPEDIMQQSLYDFLSLRLRGNPEVMPEQNVDRSHPVDIKVTWKYSSHVALIEVKWLGKSLDPSSGNLVTRTDVDARDGAQQLADYLDSNLQFARTKIVSGYLVVFDGRRWQTNNSTITISKANGEYYRNRNVNYTIKHEDIRNDFEKPRRFFMEPIVE